ncbi:MAG TPA: LysR substrate-binding domain-containing protein [Arenibaculum sp.]|nr:LysR substrate-binding domain-containing protein [Arenibaculum sp.]
MVHKFPQLNALRVFDAAARHKSFAKAAEELHVTHGAVSRQIRLLEDALGVALFERRSRAVFPTAAGVALSTTTGVVFGQIAETIRRIQGPADRSTLTISCEPTVAMKWLIPRLGNFAREYPDIQLHICAAGGPVDFVRDGIDIGLRRNDFHFEGSIHAEAVCDEWMGPVCAPRFADPSGIGGGVRLLHTQSRRTAWPDWMKAAQRSFAGADAQTFEHFYLSLQAAAAGLGVAVGSALMVEDDILNNRLVAPFSFHRDGSKYMALSLTPFASDPRKLGFLTWIRKEAEASLRNLLRPPAQDADVGRNIGDSLDPAVREGPVPSAGRNGGTVSL